MPTIYGVDPDETWEIDYCLEAIKLRQEALREPIEDQHLTAAKLAAMEVERRKALAAAEAELERYVRGSGPMFRVGHAPGIKRYEIMGQAAEGVGRALGAEKLRDVFRWEREVVRWSVRGHSNLRVRKRDGTESDMPFESGEAAVGDAKRPVVADRTLEVYAVSGLLGPLASMIVDSQRLSEPEKNA